MRTFQVVGDDLIESDTPAVILSHQFRTGYRVNVPPSWGFFDVVDPDGVVVSTHGDFEVACAQRDALNGVAS